MENLDSIFKTLNSQLKTVQEESLLNSKTKEDKELDLKVGIVKYIVSVKLEEKADLAKIKEKKLQNQQIMEILSSKKNEALQSKSIEELEAMLKDQ
ncbi:hypothetical protein D3C74_350340 [compost metagenome]